MHRPYSLGLVGWPLGHSLSPILHHAALQEAGLDGHYDLYPIPPAPEGLDELGKMIERVKSGDIHGLNVTIPHKQNVIPLLDGLTETVCAIGAVNVILHEMGKIIGDNTDAGGFIEDLSTWTKGKTCRKALVLGAGGSARAVVYGLGRLGCKVWFAARRPEQAALLVQQFQPGRDVDQIKVIHLSSASIFPILEDCDLVVNTTSVGMYPHIDETPWPVGLPFPVNAFVYDLVYNPITTKFVSQAREAGLDAANGLGMLVEQAALAFERWTGVSASREAMRKSVSTFGS